MHPRLGRFVLNGAILTHAISSGAYWALQPRGFTPFSASFVEHQLLAPALFGISVVVAIAIQIKKPVLALLGIASLAGFWIVAAGVVAFTGKTVFALASGIPMIGAPLLVWMSRRILGALAWPGLAASAIAGALLGAAFWVCAWAPPATTRPFNRAFPGPSTMHPLINRDGIQVSVEGSRIVVRARNQVATLHPGFDFASAASGGGWTLFDYRHYPAPRWDADAGDTSKFVLKAKNEILSAEAHVRIESGHVHVRCLTRLHQEIPAHLATAFMVCIEGPTRIGGIPWQGHYDPAEFVCLRNGQVQLLRAAAKEKGPFVVLQSWGEEDPEIEVGSWKLRLLGWARQASREPSPTAGWGVSQGAIEKVDDCLIWALASTSVGRGWHSVRTAAGTYDLELVLTPGP